MTFNMTEELNPLQACAFAGSRLTTFMGVAVCLDETGTQPSRLVLSSALYQSRLKMEFTISCRPVIYLNVH